MSGRDGLQCDRQRLGFDLDRHHIDGARVAIRAAAVPEAVRSNDFFAVVGGYLGLCSALGTTNAQHVDYPLLASAAGSTRRDVLTSIIPAPPPVAQMIPAALQNSAKNLCGGCEDQRGPQDGWDGRSSGFCYITKS